NHLVRGGDDARVRRIGLLRDDQFGELIADVGVRSLQRRADDTARGVAERGAGLVGDLEGAAVDAAQEVRTIEARELDFGEVEVAAVRIVADDAAAVADRNRLQRAGRETVLLYLVDLHVAVGVGELGEATITEIDRDVAERHAADGGRGQRDRA